MKFVPAVAYHFCLNLPAVFSQPRTKKVSQLCKIKSARKRQPIVHTQPLSGMTKMNLATRRASDGAHSDIIFIPRSVCCIARSNRNGRFPMHLVPPFPLKMLSSFADDTEDRCSLSPPSSLGTIHKGRPHQGGEGGLAQKQT